jgi:hypothetical protein
MRRVSAASAAFGSDKLGMIAGKNNDKATPEAWARWRLSQAPYNRGLQGGNGLRRGPTDW